MSEDANQAGGLTSLCIIVGLAMAGIAAVVAMAGLTAVVVWW